MSGVNTSPPTYVTSTIPSVCKPIILENDGIMGRMIDGSIINAGGVTGPSFTVGGRGLLFDDGSSSGLISGVGLTLQQVYNNSPTTSGQTTLQLTSGKDLQIVDSLGVNFFKVDSETGTVTISGNFVVQGNSTQIDTIIQDSDHWLISPRAGTTTALSIRPDAGVTPLVDLVTVRRTYSTSPVFRIDSNGNLIATQNLTVGGNVTVTGLVNGVDVAALNTQVATHLDGTGDRHTAGEVDIVPISNIPGATTVQEALEAISVINNPSSGTAYGYQHIQHSPAQVWVITHGRGTVRATVTIYNMAYEQIIPQEVHIIDGNTVRVAFGTPVSGSAVIIMF